MQQRQLRLGDILDDYCPRERRLTNHVVVAMIDDAVKQTRCSTCDAEHEYKKAKIPRQRRKNDAPAALYAQVAAGAPKRIAHEPSATDEEVAIESRPVEDEENDEQEEHDEHDERDERDVVQTASPEAIDPPAVQAGDQVSLDASDDEDESRDEEGEGPIHRRLIRASLPRPEGQQPPARPIPEFTIRQPNGRQNRFRPRHGRGGSGGGAQGQHGHQFGGNRSNGNMGGMRGGRPGGGGMSNRRGQGGGGGRKRSK